MTLTVNSGVPTRLKVMMALTDLLKSVTPAAGYIADLSDFEDEITGDTKARVVRGRNWFGQDDPLPLVCILENPHTDPVQHSSGRFSGKMTGPWNLLIQGWVLDDKANPTDPAHMLAAEVAQVLALERETLQQRPSGNLLGLGRVVTDIKITPALVRPPDDVSDKACFWMQVTLEMAEDLANPFA